MCYYGFSGCVFILELLIVRIRMYFYRCWLLWEQFVYYSFLIVVRVFFGEDFDRFLQSKVDSFSEDFIVVVLYIYKKEGSFFLIL